MQDEKKTTQLVEELVQLRRQVAALQQGMAETQREASALLETVPLGIHGCDIDGRVTFVNSAHAKLTGYTREEMLGSFIWDRMAPGPQRDSMPSYLKQLAEGQPPPTPFLGRSIRKNGEVHDIRVTWGYRRNSRGDVIGFVSTVADITAERQAEEAVKKAQSDLEDKIRARTAELREANKQLAIFQSFTEAAHLPFGMADMNDCVTYMNPAMCRLIGIEKPEDAIGKPLTAVYPPNYQSLWDTVVTPALHREGHWEGEVSGPVHGRTVIALQHCFLIFDEHGNPFRLATVLTDITQRKEAEEALKHERQTLKHLLQSSDHERQVIAYEIHDELAQQLAGAIMQFDTYCHQKDADPILAATTFDTGMAMLRQGHSEARRLINHVRPPILDEAGVVAALGHLVDEMRQKQDLDVQYTANVKFERLTPILENAIYRICQESLNNARRHSHCSAIRVAVEQRDDTVEMEICDDGAGFCTDDIPESRFGIAGIRERTRLLGGSCRIESTPGKGTCIYATLPLVSEDEVAADRFHHSPLNRDAVQPDCPRGTSAVW